MGKSAVEGISETNGETGVWTHWKRLMLRDWRQEEKGTTEDEKAGWHHRLDGHGFE